MRVIMVTHKVTRNDGQGRVNYEIVRHLTTNGISCHVIADEVAGGLLSEILHAGGGWTRAGRGPVGVALLREAWFAVVSARALRAVRQMGDVVIVNGAATLGPSDVNVVHFCHAGWRASRHYDPGTGVRGVYQRLYTRLNIWLERWAFRGARRLVAVSDLLADELAAIGQQRDRIHVIRNGVDPREFRPGGGSRAKLGLPAGVPLAAFVGDMGTPRKNLETALHALQLVPGLHLAVVGAHESTSYPDRARHLLVADRVHFLGFRTDVAATLRCCDLLVFPSRYEPFGLVVLEALASGLPVVTCRTAGAAEIVDDGCGIVLADPNDAEALAAAIRTVLSTLESCPAAIAAKARSVAERHDWSRMAADYLALCRRIAAERQP